MHEERCELDALAERLVGSDKPPASKPRPSDAKPEEAPPLPKPPVEGITPEAWAKLTPDEQWHRILQQCNLSLDDARAIQLAIIRKGFFSKSYKLWGGLATVTFRTAGPDHRRRVLRAIEQLPAQVTNESVDIVQNQNDLAGSLAAFDNGDETLTFEFPARGPEAKVVDELHAKRLAFVSTIPEEVLPHIQRVFQHFKTISHAALSNGAVGSF